MTILTTFDVTDGTSIDAADLNNNLTAIKNVVNGYIDNTNILAAAGINLTKLGSGTEATLAWVNVATTSMLQNKLLIGDAQPAVRLLGNGKLEWGAGGASALDTNLYRSAADTLTTDDQLVASGGLTTKTKAGAPTDADTATDVDGSIIMDTTNNRLYVRSGATWRYIPLATADPVSIPPGVIEQYAGASAPTGYLLCDGTAVNRTTYAALFAVTSTLYGVGDGSTTFNLPDFRGRIPTGYAASGGHADIGTLGNNDAVALANRRPKHNHTFTQPTISQPAVNITDSGHTHTTGQSGTQASPNEGAAIGGGSGAVRAVAANSNTTGITAALASAPTATLGAAGVGGTAAVDAPAYLVVNYIIKT